QDMDIASVKHGFQIIPSVPYAVVVKNPRTFEFRAQLQPDTGYRMQVTGARKGIGFGKENYTVAFHTEPAPKVTGASFNDAAVADWKLSFTTMVQVPSAGSTARIGASSAPIIIQIENSSQPTVRPQTGMQQADMVYEYISEFGIPRLSAIYWHPPSSLIGPVR